MAAETPIVSVIVPTYNRAGYLPTAIASGLAQEGPAVEVIVVDDGSTDGTAEVMAGYAAGVRVRYLRQANRGRSLARNRGAAEARGEWLAFLDSDDELLPGALGAHLAVMRGEQAALTLGGYEYIDEQGARLGERRPWEETDLTLRGWLFNCLGMPGSMMVRREWFARLGGFDPACEFAEDWDLFLRLARADAPMAWVRRMVCRYRQHAGNSMRELAQHAAGSMRAVEKVFTSENLPSHVAALRGQALGWVQTVFAQRAFRARQPQAGRDYLAAALSHDPDLASARREKLLDLLLTAPVGGEVDEAAHRELVMGHLPPGVRSDEGAWRRALARAEMAAFFRLARGEADDQAGRRLRAALRLDPRWLANRGVLAYCVRRALRSLPGTP